MINRVIGQHMTYAVALKTGYFEDFKQVFEWPFEDMIYQISLYNILGQ